MFLPTDVGTSGVYHIWRCMIMWIKMSSTVCPTRYQTQHFFNNSNTNEDIAMKFVQEYVRCVRNEEEYVCSPLQILFQYPH